MSDSVLLLIFAASVCLGVLLALWLASSTSDFAKSKIIERLVVGVLYVGTIGALLVIALAVAGRSGDFGLIPVIAEFFMDGIIVAALATRSEASSPIFKSRDSLRNMVLSQRVIRGSRYLTVSYFLMVGLFKWITYAEYSFFQASGYSKTFYIFICAFECVCAVGLLVRVTVLPVVFALSVEMVGAVYTHFHNYFAKGLPDPFSNSLDAFRMLILLGYIAVATLEYDAPLLKEKSGIS